METGEYKGQEKTIQIIEFYGKNNLFRHHISLDTVEEKQKCWQKNR